MEAGTVLGFDVGSKCIGVAITSALSGVARELDVVPVHGDPDWARIDRLVADWSPIGLVVGDPLQLEAEKPDQPNRRRARAFARQALQRYRLPVWMVDERHSSQEAARRFADDRARGARRRRDAARIDALAAVVILDRWLLQPGAAMEMPST